MKRSSRHQTAGECQKGVFGLLSRKKCRYVWVDERSALKEMVARLREQPVMAVDTESDSLYVYYEKICLLQLSIPGVDYLVDPLAVDMAPLGALFASSRHEKVFHAAENDILGLKRDFGFNFKNLFDTMLAARVLGWRRYGLGSILQDQFGVQANKRMQRYNWGTRPLSDQALDYARMDTHYLLRLRNIQLKELKSRNRTDEARQAFRRREKVEPSPKVFDPDRFRRIRGAQDLAPADQALLRELYIFRDDLAREMNLPPFKVIADATLVRLVETKPNNCQTLRQIQGLSHRVWKKHGDSLLAATARGLKAPAPTKSSRNSRSRPSEKEVIRYEALRNWRKGVAEARDVEPDVILSNHILSDLARQAPSNPDALTKVETLDDWQRKTYGRQILQVLKTNTG